MDDVEIVEGAPRIGADELCRRVAHYLRSTGVERAILFGSFARGDADIASDADLVLVERTSLPFPERGRVHRPLFRLGIGVDLLVYTPEEYERMRREGNPLIERIEREGRLVHERSDC